MMYELNKKYTNRYGDEYWWEHVENETYEFRMTGNSMKYGRNMGSYDEEKKMITSLVAFDPSGGPYIAIGTELDGGKIISISRGMDEDSMLVEVEYYKGEPQ